MRRLSPRTTRLLSQVALFVGLVIGLELFSSHQLQRQGLETAAGVATPDPTVRWRLRSDPEVNADGIRNPPVASPRPPGELRILCLGGSVAYGYGLTAPQTYERQMETLLRQHVAADVRVNVINAGIPGFTSDQVAALLYELGDLYQPQIVLVMAGFNEPGVKRWEGPGVASSSAVRRLLYRSATYRYLHRLLKPDVEASPHDAWHLHTVDNLACIADYCEARGAHLLLAFEARRSWSALKVLEAPPGAPPRKGTYPNLTAGRDPRSTRRLEAAIEALAARRGLPFIDMDALLRDVARRGHGEDDVFLERDAVHLNPYGASLVADVLTQEVVRSGWLTP